MSINIKTHIIYYVDYALNVGGQYMYVMVTLSSVTTAKKLERALKDIGIPCSTMHTPKIISQHGCSHSVRIKKANLELVLKLSNEMGINVRGIFAVKDTAKGKTEYEKIG